MSGSHDSVWIIFATMAMAVFTIRPRRKRRTSNLRQSCYIILSLTSFVSGSIWSPPFNQVFSSQNHRNSPTRLRLVLNEAGFLEDAALPRSHRNGMEDILAFDSVMDILDQSASLRHGSDSDNDKESNTPFSNSYSPLALHLSPQIPSDTNVEWGVWQNLRSTFSDPPPQKHWTWNHPAQQRQSPTILSNNNNKHRFRSTGTTIAGCLVAGGKVVILGADTRATSDRLVADKYCFKIHTLGRNVACCGAGTAADLEAFTRQCQYSLALQCLQEDSIGNDENSSYQQVIFADTVISSDNTLSQQQSSGVWMRPVPFSRVCRMLRDALYEAGGNLGVNLIVGGVDSFRNSNNSGCAHLVAIHPHGSMDVVPFSALGSGGLAAMAVLEQRYRPDMTVEEGMILIQQAITAGIQNDLGSGSQVDICVIHADQGATVNITRAIVPEETLTEYDEPNDYNLSDSPASNSGVNGFGNLPYQVLSRRIVASLRDNEERHSKWSDLLGL